MDIKSPLGSVLRQRNGDGEYELVPEGIRDRRRGQVFGATTKNRIYRYSEERQQYAILSEHRDSFSLVWGLEPGEEVRRDGKFTADTLLPRKTFLENCREEHIPAFVGGLLRTLFSSLVFGGGSYLVWHWRTAWNIVRNAYQNFDLGHLSEEAVKLAMRSLHALKDTNPIAGRRLLAEAYPSETGWSNPLDAPLAAVSRSTPVVPNAASLVAPVAGAVVVGGSAAYAMTRHESQTANRSHGALARLAGE